MGRKKDVTTDCFRYGFIVIEYIKTLKTPITFLPKRTSRLIRNKETNVKFTSDFFTNMFYYIVVGYRFSSSRSKGHVKKFI